MPVRLTIPHRAPVQCGRWGLVCTTRCVRRSV